MLALGLIVGDLFAGQAALAQSTPAAPDAAVKPAADGKPARVFDRKSALDPKKLLAAKLAEVKEADAKAAELQAAAAKEAEIKAAALKAAEAQAAQLKEEEAKAAEAKAAEAKMAEAKAADLKAAELKADADNKPAAAPEPVAAPGGDPSTVSVSANRPTNRIDRQVYDVKSDASNTNASAADALNNVPSVNVDPDGTVTLRGSTSVQILIDGKPSAMMSGDNRGAALAAIPSEDIESIEVINNPGAQFGNEGGALILNIVMRRSRRPGGFGVVNSNIGSAGRYNSGVSGTYNDGRYSFQGGLNVRHDGRNSTADITRERIDAVTAVDTRSAQTSVSTGLNDALGVNGSVNYNLGDKDTLGANMSFNTRTNDQKASDRYITFGQGTTAPVNDYVRSTVRSGDSRNYSYGARMNHKGEIDGENLKIDLRVSSSDNASDSAYANVYAVSTGGVDGKSLQGSKSGNKIVDFTGDYERPDDSGLTKLGYKIYNNKNSYDTAYFNIDPLTQAQSLNTIRSNRFDLKETDLAVYGSYQLRLNEKWGVLGGLRVEYTKMDIEQLTMNILASNHYINYLPSFFVSYKQSDDTTIRFSYSHRFRRPGAGDLNPFVVYRDEVNVSSGNPKLKPTQTDSVELAYESKAGPLDANLRGYYRKESDTITERRYFISDTVLLTTRDNGGGRQSGGLEFTLSGKLTPALTLNTSGNLAYGEVKILDAAGIETVRRGTALNLRARVNYQVTVDDMVQVSVNRTGRGLSGLGYRLPNSTANFTLRHNFSPTLNVVMNVTDAFNTNKGQTYTDTDLLKDTSVRRYDGRIIYVGLSYRFGGITQLAKK